ncbi:hypothetical protein D3C85_1466340 [compost metagenome]
MVSRETPRDFANEREAGKGFPAASAPSRISCRMARWIRECNGKGWSSGCVSPALTDSSRECLNKWSAHDENIGGEQQAIKAL